MNLSEGSKRLAVLMGVLGALVGSYWSVVITFDLVEEHNNYKLYSRLAATLAVKTAVAQRKLMVSKLPPNETIADDSENIQREGVDYVIFNENGSIMWIKPTIGEPVGATNGASFSEAILVPVLPAAGFFILWGLIKALAWVLIGFTKSATSNISNSG